MPNFGPVFVFTTRGNEDVNFLHISHYVTGRARARAEGASEMVTLFVTIRFYLAGTDAGEHQLTGRYTRRRGQKFVLQSAEVDGKAMSNGDFELLTHIGKQWPTDEQMLPYAFDGLKIIASNSDTETRSFLKHRCSTAAKTRRRSVRCWICSRGPEKPRCITYIVRRTQLYLDDDLWRVLQIRSRQEKTTISALARQAIRDRYLSKAQERKAAMTAIVGMWRDRDDIGDSTAYIRALRKDRRSESPWKRKPNK